MTESQRRSLIDMAHAVRRVGHIDPFTKARAERLLTRLTGHPFWMFDLA